MAYDDDELESRIASVKIPYDHRKAGGEINFKAKRRWEILRRTTSYRQDWDAAFSDMVKMLRTFQIISCEDYGCDPKIDELMKDPKTTMQDISEEIKKSTEEMDKIRAELMKDPLNWEEFLNNKFENDWPPDKLKEEFIYNEQGRKLADKYGLFLPYHYDDPLWDPYKDRMKSVFKNMEPVRMIVHKPSKYEMGPDSKIIADHTPNLWDERWLRIEIDLYSDSLTEIWSRIKSMIAFYRPLCNPYNIEKRGPALNIYLDTENRKVSIYELWDMNKLDAKSLWQITKEMYPIATNGKHYQTYESNYNSDVRAKWAQIKNAVKSVNIEIEKAEKEINSPV